MVERLPWIKLQPRSLVLWDAWRDGPGVIEALRRQYPQATCHLPVPETAACDVDRSLRALWARPWWSWERWSGGGPRIGLPQEPVDLLWSNMDLHWCLQPGEQMRQWADLLNVDGFLMFSCLGPDTIRELRDLYQEQGWSAPAHEMTDMHDYGDMLVEAGFADPVMDMERISLRFSSPERLLRELRGLGRNAHRERFPGLRGRLWRQALVEGIARRLSDADDSSRPADGYTLTFEVIYGHALKPSPRVKLSEESAISLRQMRQMLRQR